MIIKKKKNFWRSKIKNKFVFENITEFDALIFHGNVKVEFLHNPVQTEWKLEEFSEN